MGLVCPCISYLDQMLMPFKILKWENIILATRGDVGASGKGVLVPILELGRAVRFRAFRIASQHLVI